MPCPDELREAPVKFMMLEVCLKAVLMLIAQRRSENLRGFLRIIRDKAVKVIVSQQYERIRVFCFDCGGCFYQYAVIHHLEVLSPTRGFCGGVSGGYTFSGYA